MFRGEFVVELVGFVVALKILISSFRLEKILGLEADVDFLVDVAELILPPQTL